MRDGPAMPAPTRPVDDETDRVATLRAWASPRGLGREIYWTLRDQFEPVARDSTSAHRLALRATQTAYLRSALDCDIAAIAAVLDVGVRTVERDLALLRALDIEALSFCRRPRIPLTLLEDLERRARLGGRDGLHARWQFGRELLAARRGRGRLENGVLANVEASVGVTRSEASSRLAFAARFPTEADAWQAIDHYASWRRIVHEAVPAARRAALPTRRRRPSATRVAA